MFKIPSSNSQGEDDVPVSEHKDYFDLLSQVPMQNLSLYLGQDDSDAV